jgi:chromate reductase, NAD(P)H dehydrogenase (quinone)
MAEIRVLGIAGSLRSGSYNRRLLELAIEQLPDAEWTVARLRAIPPYDGDLEAQGLPPAVERFKGEILATDAIVIATPEYNRSVPGVLKNAIDWASRPAMRSPLVRKPVVLMGASPGRGGAARALEHLRQILESTLAVPLPEVLSVPHVSQRFRDGRWDEGLRQDLSRALAQLSGGSRSAGLSASPAAPCDASLRTKPSASPNGTSICCSVTRTRTYSAAFADSTSRSARG